MGDIAAVIQSAFAFDITRETLLTYPLPPIRVGPDPTMTSTRSRYRLRWNELAIWPNFDFQVVNYWNTVSQNDKTALVAPSVSLYHTWSQIAGLLATSEEHVKGAVSSYPINFHSLAANGGVGLAVARSPMPSDLHSVIVECSVRASQFNLAGVPDFVMHYPNRVTALMEVKNPRLVTPQQIDEVLNSTIHSFYHASS